MQRNKRLKLRVALVMVVLAAVIFVGSGSLVAAQTGGGYDLSWGTVAGGGTASTGGGFSLGGTIGQAAAGSMTGGDFTMSGGFWTGGAALSSSTQNIYLPLVTKN